MVERLELEVRALEGTARAWEVLSGLLGESIEEVRSLAASSAAREWATSAPEWGEILVEAEAARVRTAAWAAGLRAVVDDMAGTEAQVVADLSAVVRRLRP